MTQPKPETLEGEKKQGWSEWKKTTKVVRWLRGHSIMPECCYCRRPAAETEMSAWEIPPETPTEEISYCLPYPRFRCAPRKGCNKEPWSLRGKHLRQMMQDGPPSFVRLRDRTHWQFVE